jgi:hypothetical protein
VRGACIVQGGEAVMQAGAAVRQLCVLISQKQSSYRGAD